MSGLASGSSIVSLAALVWAAITAVVTSVAVALVRRYALRHGVLDRPNERSSHVRPTPRGGGLGLVAVLLLLMPVALGGLTATTLVLEIAIAAVALVGWLDDRSALGVRPRIAVHLGAAMTVSAGAVAWHAGTPTPLPIWAAAIWWVVWSVSAINVVNFMDGIDGLIGSQMLIYAIYITVSASSGSVVELLSAMCAGGCVGFLVFNWSPARIFLGDVGSGALGLIAVVMGAALLVDRDSSIVRVFLPLLPLFSDATVTLLRRAARGERIWTAHREHLYQRLANGRWTHARTAAIYALTASIGALVASVDGMRTFTIAALAYAIAVGLAGSWLETRIRHWSRGIETAASTGAPI